MAISDLKMASEERGTQVFRMWHRLSDDPTGTAIFVFSFYDSAGFIVEVVPEGTDIFDSTVQKGTGS